MALKLLNITKKLEVASEVRVARSFYARTKGLLGERGLAQGSALWIQGTRLVGCNSIHTWFMRFSIDAVFVDRELKVRAVYRDLRPWRMTWPAAGAQSVFELAAGSARTASIEVGDQLNLKEIPKEEQSHVMGG